MTTQTLLIARRRRVPMLFVFTLLIALLGCGDPAGSGADATPDATTSVDTTAPDTSPQPDIVDDVEPPEPTVLTVRYDPEGEGFYDSPWPTDARLTAAGTPDMSAFPGASNLLILNMFKEEIETGVEGFATMPVIYVAMGSGVSGASLPRIAETINPSSPVQLLDLSPERCGERVPVEVAFNTDGDTYIDDFVMQVSPSIGSVLRPATTYGLVVLTRFGEGDGKSTARPEGFEAVWGDATGSEPFSASLSPLRDCLPQTGLADEDIAVATVFTTQDPVRETRALYEAVIDPAKIETRPITDWAVDEAWTREGRLITYTGTVEMPIFQEGETPYSQTGGGLVFDAQGEPVVQRWEAVPIALTVADDRTFNAAAPVLLFIDGTGWDRWTHVGDNWTDVALDDGYVIASFMPQFHGERAGFTGNTELSTFNFFNPPAGRTNFRQQAAETSYFIRVLEEQTAGLTGLPALDTDDIVYGGQSQGALNGALVAAFERKIGSYVLNGLSAYLTLTLLERKDPVDFSLLIQTTFKVTRTFDRFYPLLQLMQLATETVDTHNYSRLWQGWEGNPGGNNVLVINGIEDHTSAQRGMDQLTITADLDLIEPAGWSPDPTGLWRRLNTPVPIQGNRDNAEGGSVTLATFLDGATGHFTVYQRRASRDLSGSFWNTANDTSGPPILDYARESLCSDGVDNDRDGVTDCGDEDCSGFGVCREGACDNGMDEERDGLTDCEDPDCALSEPCIERNCEDELDGDDDGQIDCDDPDCSTYTVCLERVCDDGLDFDGNGLTDCEDLMCLRDLEACPAPYEEVCGDGDDSDGDGLMDCADPDCALDPSCGNTSCADGDLGSAVGPRVFTSTIVGRPNTFPPSNCLGLGSGADTPDIALRWVAPATGEFIFSTEGSEPDTLLKIHAADCSTLALDCDDDHRGSSGAHLAFEVVEATEYVIVISAFDPEEAEGLIRLSIIAPTP